SRRSSSSFDKGTAFSPGEFTVAEPTVPGLSSGANGFGRIDRTRGPAFLLGSIAELGACAAAVAAAADAITASRTVASAGKLAAVALACSGAPVFVPPEAVGDPGSGPVDCPVATGPPGSGVGANVGTGSTVVGSITAAAALAARRDLASWMRYRS